MPEFRPYLEKVTGFVTRFSPAGGLQMLLFRHPYAGVQIPAGTVEEGETPKQAVLREVWEETGLADVRVIRQIGWRDELPPDATHVICQGTTVYARPDPGSFDWARLPRGVVVTLLRSQGDYAQISYIENDRYPDPQYTTYQITGWVPITALASANRRYFFHLHADPSTPDHWEQASDQHRFTLFWANLDDLPEIVTPQNTWLETCLGEAGYNFEVPG